MITIASQQIIVGLKEIWKKSFGEPEEYMDFFFLNRLRLDNTYVYWADNKPVSMLTLMPATIYIDGSYKAINYVYGVSTLPEYRGRGFSSRLMEHINKNTEAISILHPASDGLFRFYEKQGYKTSFYIKEARLNKNEISYSKIEFSCSIATPSEYKTLRDKYFEGDAYVNWDINAIEYAINENKFTGGKALIIESAYGRHIMLYRVWEKTLYIRETSVDDSCNLFYTLINELMSQEGAENVHFRLHPKSLIKIASVKKFAMLHGGALMLNNGYFNLALD